MKIISLFFIVLIGITNVNSLESDAEVLDFKNSINCNETEYKQNSTFTSFLLNIFLDHECQNSESPIWKVTIKSNGDWECETGSSYQCFPCIQDDEE